MKGIILAGGSGSRLYPVTLAVNKHLLPVYDKPLIYYSLSTLMLAGIRDILVISNPDSLLSFKTLLGNGSVWGIAINYVVQDKPEGVAQAFKLGRSFIGQSNVCLILGDNLFYGHNLQDILWNASSSINGATIFAYQVSNPQHYGVVEIDTSGSVQAVVEKPKQPKSNYAVTGLYFYDSSVTGIASELKPSKRGELEITDVNNVYLKQHKLTVIKLERGIAWLDAGSPSLLLEASNFVSVFEKRQGLKICCPEEIAFRQGWISLCQLDCIVKKFKNSDYGAYLRKLNN